MSADGADLRRLLAHMDMAAVGDVYKRQLLLLSNCDPLCWARSWWAALRAAFFVSNKISILTGLRRQ